MPHPTEITPVILTFNEEANLHRTLSNLIWAKRIVIVDSYSTDGTQRIAEADPRVILVSRAFDCHANQWNFAIEQPSIETDWILALDADYQVTQEVVGELSAIANEKDVNAYRVGFRYAVLGKLINSGVYPPVVCLFRRGRGHYSQDGHTQRLEVQGQIGELKNRLVHDDRKEFSRWISAQTKYARLEAEKLAKSGTGVRAWIRTRTPFAAIAMGLYCLLIRRGLFEGPSGWLYALQRVVAEGLISIAYLENRLRRGTT